MTIEASETTFTVDLEHLGRKQVIAAHVLPSPTGIAIVDPGPAAALPALRRGLAEHGLSTDMVTAILLTHIHFDHAGATGSLVEDNQAIHVYVHERGAKHMIAPERLVASATRLYGDAMDFLWGPFLPVPSSNVHALAGGETIACNGTKIEVVYTPGHASHHVCYLDEGSGAAFTGDVAGCRISRAPYVMPPTPPPDIDIEVWLKSIDRIEDWSPTSLRLTHFDAIDDVGEHLDELRKRLADWSRMVRRLLDDAPEPAAAKSQFADTVRDELRAHVSSTDLADCYELGVPIDSCWAGLKRYWEKRG